MIDKVLVLLIALQVFFRSSFFDNRLLPYLDVGGSSSLGLNDLTFFIMLLVVLYKFFSGQVTSISMPFPIKAFIAFLFIGVIGFINAAAGDTGFHLAAREARYFFVYLLFFAVVALSPTKKNIESLTKLVLIIAVITAIFSVLQVVIGERIGFLFGKVSTLNTLDSDVEGVTRVGSGGLASINLAFFLALSAMLTKMSNKSMIIIGIVFAALFVSFNRGTWVSIVLATFFMFPFIGAKLRGKAIKIFAVLGSVATLVFVLGVFGSLGSKVQNYTDAGIARFSSLLPGHIEEDGSTLDRFSEAETVFKKYLSRPIIGHGLGAVTQDNVRIRGEDGSSKNEGSWGYVHNGYLYVLFKLGAFGLLIFLVFIVTFVMRSLIEMKNLNEGVYKTYYIGYLLFVVSIVPHSIVSPRIMEGKYITIIALSIGMLELIRKYLSLKENGINGDDTIVEAVVVGKKEKYPSVTLKKNVNVQSKHN